eukprot:sb/3478271/
MARHSIVLRDLKFRSIFLSSPMFQVLQTPAVDQQNLGASKEAEQPTKIEEETPQEVPQETVVPQQDAPKQYLYDYSTWFQQVQGPDGITYYQATDGNVSHGL